MMRRQGLVMWLAVGICLVTALPAIMAAPAAALSFAPPVHYGLGGRPADLATADVNGDGVPDMVASAGREVDVLLGRGLGRFAPATSIPMEHRPGALVLTDFDGDGAVDVVMASGDGTVSILLGDGSGAFVLKGTFPAGVTTSDVAVGDLTADGVPDVATADGDGLSILAGDGAGGLLSPLHLAVGDGCRRIVAGDLNFDGALDLAFTRNSWEDYSGFGVLLGDGAGGFAPMAVYGTHLEPYGLALCDFNADRRPDLAALSTLEGSVAVDAFLGDGLGALIRACYVFVGDYRDTLSVSGLAVGDLNRDGRADVVTTAYRSGYIVDGEVVPPGPPRIHILLSHSYDGVFLEPTSFLAGRVPGEVIVADLNGDRSLDLATTDVETRSLSVRMNGVLPRLTGVSPAQGHVGDVVTLTGRRFGHMGAVRFGGTTVTDYLSWDPFKIKVRVPAGTAKGRVMVTVRTNIGRSAPMPFLRL
jgi:hypothetical protein